MITTTRRTVVTLLAAGAVALSAALPARAQDKPTLRFSAVFSERAMPQPCGR